MSEPDKPIRIPEGAGSGGGWRMLVGVLFEPGKSFAYLREHPHIIAPYLTMSVASAVTGWLVAGRFAAAMLAAMPAGGQMPPGMAGGMATAVKAMSVLGAAVSPWIMGVVVAGVLALVGVFAGGEAGFKQIMSVAGYAYLPTSVIGGLVKGVLVAVSPAANPMQLMARAAGATSAAVFLPPEQFGTLTYKLASLLDPFALWSLALLVVGYAAVSRFKTSKAAALIVPIWLLLNLVGAAFSNMKAPMGT